MTFEQWLHGISLLLREPLRRVIHPADILERAVLESWYAGEKSPVDAAKELAEMYRSEAAEVGA